MDDDRELVDAVDELSETLEALHAELHKPARDRIDPPRPPTPRELLRITEQYTIPAVIALLEASVRALELLGATIRVTDGRPLEGSTASADDASREGVDRLASAGSTTLELLDDGLRELQRAAVSSDPDNPELRRLLDRARELRDEVDARLVEATANVEEQSTRSRRPDRSRSVAADDRRQTTGRRSGADHPEPVDIDVAEELETIKREVNQEIEPGDGPNDEVKTDDDSDTEVDQEAHDDSSQPDRFDPDDEK